MCIHICSDELQESHRTTSEHSRELEARRLTWLSMFPFVLATTRWQHHSGSDRHPQTSRWFSTLRHVPPVDERGENAQLEQGAETDGAAAALNTHNALCRCRLLHAIASNPVIDHICSRLFLQSVGEIEFLEIQTDGMHMEEWPFTLLSRVLRPLPNLKRIIVVVTARARYLGIMFSKRARSQFDLNHLSLDQNSFLRE